MIESSEILVEILPAVGGKIAQIRHKGSGREYLVPAQRPYQTIAADGDWLQHDTSGMDDCFPNVAAGGYPELPWNSLELPDLGEWSHGIWKVSRSTGREAVLERSGEVLPYTVTKTICLVSEQTLSCSYTIQNHGESPIRYLWSLHPLITVEGSYEIVLPEGAPQVRTFPADGFEYQWPMWNNVDLSREFVAPGRTLKIFVSGLSEGWCMLHQPFGTLRFEFDLNEVPALGIWFNNRGFPGDGNRPFRCIALEPCTSPTDLLDELSQDAYRFLKAGASTSWSWQLELSDHTS